MSSTTPNTGDLAGGDEETAGIERIADPDDYAVRRRLRQLHDARDAVREVKDEAFRLEKSERSIKPTDRDQFVAERLADYIAEVAVVLEQTDEDHEAFLDEAVQTTGNLDRDEVTLRQLRDQRGLVGERGVIHYATAMRAWVEANRHFENVAGAEFESSGLPTESGFNPVVEDA